MMLVSSPVFAEHTPPPGHPERPERAQVFDAIAERYRDAGVEVSEPRAASRQEIERIHTADYLAAVAATDGRAARLDPDTFTSPETWRVAELAAGAAIDAARLAVERSMPTLALVRPPGHHAEPDRAMGFCFLNNIAIAAAALRANGTGRVAIVDIDVHHGNGTQRAFYSDPAVLYVSTHQYPFYPGTGAATEIGEGPGRGFTLNIPFEAGATDADYARAYDVRILPALEAFRPDAILVSAGYDAHERDPLGGMRLTTAGYGDVVRRLDEAARRLCHRRLSLVTEGGYHLGALADCLSLTIDVLS